MGDPPGTVRKSSPMRASAAPPGFPLDERRTKSQYPIGSLTVSMTGSARYSSSASLAKAVARWASGWKSARVLCRECEQTSKQKKNPHTSAVESVIRAALKRPGRAGGRTGGGRSCGGVGAGLYAFHSRRTRRSASSIHSWGHLCSRKYASLYAGCRTATESVNELINRQGSENHD